MLNPFQLATPVAKKLKILFYGSSGSGKTIAALTFPRAASGRGCISWRCACPITLAPSPCFPIIQPPSPTFRMLSPVMWREMRRRENVLTPY